MCVGSWFLCIGLCAFVGINVRMKGAKLEDFASSMIEEGTGTRKGGIGESGRTIMETSSGDPKLPPFKPYPTNGTF